MNPPVTIIAQLNPPASTISADSLPLSATVKQHEPIPPIIKHHYSSSNSQPTIAKWCPQNVTSWLRITYKQAGYTYQPHLVVIQLFWQTEQLTINNPKCLNHQPILIIINHHEPWRTNHPQLTVPSKGPWHPSPCNHTRDPHGRMAPGRARLWPRSAWRLSARGGRRRGGVLSTHEHRPQQHRHHARQPSPGWWLQWDLVKVSDG